MGDTNHKTAVDHHKVDIGDIVQTSYGTFKVADIEEDIYETDRGWMTLAPVYGEGDEERSENE